MCYITCLLKLTGEEFCLANFRHPLKIFLIFPKPVFPNNVQLFEWTKNQKFEQIWSQITNSIIPVRKNITAILLQE